MNHRIDLISHERLLQNFSNRQTAFYIFASGQKYRNSILDSCLLLSTFFFSFVTDKFFHSLSCLQSIDQS